MKYLIEAIFWLAIFLSPVIIIGSVAAIVFLNDFKIAGVAIGFFAVALGIFFAERVRKKYGCSTFIGRLLGTPEIWPNEANEISKSSDRKKENKN